MPKTIEKTFGDKTYVMRVKIPLQILDWAMRNAPNLDIDEEKGEEMTPEKIELSFVLRNMLARKMVLKPIMDKAYLESDDADEDDFECLIFLQTMLGERIEARFEHLKVSPSDSHA